MAEIGLSDIRSSPQLTLQSHSHEEGRIIDLAQAINGSADVIIVMICRRWTTTNRAGNISSGYIASDNKGNIIQLHAIGSNAHLFETRLVEGNIYTIASFTVVPTNSLYTNWSLSTHLIRLDSNTEVTAMNGSTDGFVRFPLSLISLEDIHAERGTYIVDVMGLIANVGEISTTPLGDDVLEFDLVNERGSSIRTILLGSLGSVLLGKQDVEAGVHTIVLTGMKPKKFRGEFYLTSTCATIVYTAHDIPYISDLVPLVRDADLDGTHFASAVFPFSDKSLTQILYIGRAHKSGGNKETATLNCMVTIKNIRDDKPWFYYWCGVCSCTKGVDEVGGVIWCECCESICEVPLARIRLLLDVSDGTTTIAVTVPDEAAETLVGISAATLINNAKVANGLTEIPREIQVLVNTRHVLELKSHTYVDHGQYESFVCTAIVKPHSHTQLGIISLTRNRSNTPHAITTTGMLNSPYNLTRKISVTRDSTANPMPITPAIRPAVRRMLNHDLSDEE